jgi:phenylacetate-CoA ligase
MGARMTLTDANRFPLLTADGERLLRWMREHPHAPKYTATCGNRLTAQYLDRVRAYESELEQSSKGWPQDGYPAWLDEFVEMCFRDVPFYRHYGDQPPLFTDIPTTARADLAREIWSFVPDPLPLNDLIIYNTSGTTGHPLTVLSHPVVGACYTPLYKTALRHYGIELKAGHGQIGCVLVGWQRNAYTYPSVTPQQDETGHIKLNLHPDDWRDPADRARFLDDCNPELYTGDPLAFAELMTLPLKTRPRALISTAMHLLPGLRQQLEGHFGCPVLDVYSMNESGPIGVFSNTKCLEDTSCFSLLQPHLYIEILDPDGDPCPPGVRGEVTLTGGLNFFLPLLRYRTNDFAALEWQGGQPMLVGLEGRAPVTYRGSNGQTINNLDVTNALKTFAIPQYTFHQNEDQSIHLKFRGTANTDAVHKELLQLFGNNQIITIEETTSLAPDKIAQYTSDFKPS